MEKQESGRGEWGTEEERGNRRERKNIREEVGNRIIEKNGEIGE